MNLSLSIARRSGCNETCQREVLLRVAGLLPSFPMDSTPPEISIKIQSIIKKFTGVNDPFAEEKMESNRIALQAAYSVKKVIDDSSNPLLTATEFAIAGNSLDYYITQDMDLLKVVREQIYDKNTHTKNENPLNFQFTEFTKDLESYKSLLYITDNAGEIVFDRLLIEVLKERFPHLEITVAVKNSPVINDAILYDAEEVGLTKLVPVISSGSESTGTILSHCTSEFLDKFWNVDLVVAKGQGNYETLSDVNRGIYLLFKSKCKVIAEHSGSNIGDIMLVKSGNNNSQ